MRIFRLAVLGHHTLGIWKVYSEQTEINVIPIQNIQKEYQAVKINFDSLTVSTLRSLCQNDVTWCYFQQGKQVELSLSFTLAFVRSCFTLLKLNLWATLCIPEFDACNILCVHNLCHCSRSMLKIVLISWMARSAMLLHIMLHCTVWQLWLQKLCSVARNCMSALLLCSFEIVVSYLIVPQTSSFKHKIIMLLQWKPVNRTNDVPSMIIIMVLKGHCVVKITKFCLIAYFHILPSNPNKYTTKAKKSSS